MKFAADKTVGKLARWLRAMGYDCVSVKEPMEFFKNPESGRIFLTRARTIRGGDPKAHPCIMLVENSLKKQLQELVSHIPDLLKEPSWFSRCILCNTPIRNRTKETLRGEVPDFIYETKDEFKECPDCGKIYWKGSHPGRMQKYLEMLLVEDDP